MVYIKRPCNNNSNRKLKWKKCGESKRIEYIHIKQSSSAPYAVFCIFAIVLYKIKTLQMYSTGCVHVKCRKCNTFANYCLFYQAELDLSKLKSFVYVMNMNSFFICHLSNKCGKLNYYIILYLISINPISTHFYIIFYAMFMFFCVRSTICCI